MEIYVYNHRDNFLITKYKTKYIPTLGEMVYFPHFGSFVVRNVVYNISDDTYEDNEVMWIDLFVEE